MDAIKRIIAVMLALAMSLSLFSINVWAIEEPQEGDVFSDQSSEGADSTAPDDVEIQVEDDGEEVAPIQEETEQEELPETEQEDLPEAEQEETLLVQDTVSSGRCGNGLTWSLESDGKLTISGTGAIPDFIFVENPPDRPWGANLNLIKQIKSVIIEDGVTSIGNGAFAVCENLSSVTIPDSVTSIGIRAFYKCSRLTNLNSPATMTSIGQEAFEGCTTYLTHSGSIPIATGYQDGSIMGACGEKLTWKLERNGTLTISGTGSMDDYLILV